MKIFKKIIISIFLLNSSITPAKVLIITHSYNRPDFIEIQHKTFKKFLQDDYEFVVFNDATDPKLKQEISKTCQRLLINCYPIPQEIHSRPYLHREKDEDFNSPSVRSVNAIQYSLDVLGFNHNGIVTIIDSDMFLTKLFSITSFMNKHELAGVPQSRQNIEYLWIGLVFINMPNLPNKKTLNFNCGKINGISVDAGGHTYHYLSNHPKVSVAKFGPLYIQSLACSKCQIKNNNACIHNTLNLKAEGFDDCTIKFIQNGPPNMEFILNKTFLHYRGGTNWDHKTSSYHQQKTILLNRYINEVLQS